MFSTKLTKPDDDEYKKIKEMYQSTIPALEKESQQGSLFNILALGYKHDIPLLQWFLDSYTRDRILAWHETKTLLTITEWAKKKNISSLLTKVGLKRLDLIHGLQTWGTRIFPTMQFQPNVMIEDSIERICEIATDAAKFIKWMIGEGDEIHLFPFQIDVTIIPNRVTEIQGDGVDGDEDDSEDDSDDEDADPPDVNQTNENQTSEEKTDLGNLRIDGIDEKQKCSLLRSGKEQNARIIFDHLYKKFKDEHRHKHKKEEKIDMDKKNENGDGNGDGDGDNNENEGKYIPDLRRMCVIADRRGVYDESMKKPKETKWFFFSPNQESKFPTHNMFREWSFHASKSYIYSKITPEKTTKDKKIVSAATAAGGYLFVLSFHVFAKDDVKCYLYNRGGMIRFYSTV